MKDPIYEIELDEIELCEMEPYKHSLDHLSDELIRLDIVLEIEMQRMKKLLRQDPTTEAFRGIFMSSSEAQALLDDDEPFPEFTSDQKLMLQRLEQGIASRLELTRKKGLSLPLLHLKNSFHLSDLDIRMLIVAIAPHVNRKYLKLFAYLQEDMTSQYLTIDHMLRLCCTNSEERRQAVARLTSASNGIRAFLAMPKLDNSSPTSSLLLSPIRLQERMVYYILGLDWHDERILPHLKLYPTDENTLPLLIDQKQQEHMFQYSKQYQGAATPLVWMLHGPSGCGKTHQARHLCGRLGRSLLEWDLFYAPEEEFAFLEAVDRVLLEAKLLDAVPAFDRIHLFQSSAHDQRTASKDLRQEWLLNRLGTWDGMVFLFGEEKFKPILLPTSMKWIDIPLFIPGIGERQKLWRTITKDTFPITDADAGLLAVKFRFPTGKIMAAVEEAKKQEVWRDITAEPHIPRPSNTQILHQSAYQLISHRLKDKAVKMEARFGWEDLILPPETIQLLRQACSRLQHRHTVMYRWGFDRKMAYGKGISMLFTGPPGTGKTMSAMVIAREMDAELYRIDLSRVVSKYIGETEKNLSDIFEQARLSGAILFFDEADALFGKRSEVKDSHDKYANMETSYLLQKMEEYDGLTILATNFSQNLDEAFTRRIQFIIKYPFPDAVQREQLWRSAFPSQLPVEEIDFAFLAQTFDLAGGPIKNIVLTASFLAASEGVPVSMKQLIEGAMQEYKKTGKLLLKDRLGPYADYVSSPI
ncbi:AAA family ATPase [Ammoniphilus resinae]|uniref:DNA polymerase III delta prime subunit n=1 Tax=Ammoniphilus resinae TaxID=861532 RepID=A0ABS4GPT4_9BACL|nr:AAA family ATPase [Ammoniphilus resinae]MBP1932278.1 DNA polymerase III delta prime subunit [Ammoniphilus resinae]